MKTPFRTKRYLAFQAHLHRHLRVLGLSYHLYPLALMVTPTTFLNTLPVARALTVAVLELHFPELAPFPEHKDEFVDELLIRIVHAVRMQVALEAPNTAIEAAATWKQEENDEEEMELLRHVADPMCEWFLRTP